MGRLLEKVCRVATFIGPDCKGNVHDVRLFANELPNMDASTDEDTILVELAPASDSAHMLVRFSRAGHWIRHCGSGTLAAAYVLLGKPLCGTFAAHIKHLLPVNDPEKRCLNILAEGDGFAYLAPAPTLLPSVVDTRAASAMGDAEQPEQALQTADGQYQVWVYANAEEVQSLVPDFQALAQLKNRAWIVTAPDAKSDYVLRYFAPAYGTSEDAATGSANVVIAAYWQNRLNKSLVSGRQLSIAGGMFKVRSMPDLNCQQVFGYVRELPV